MAEAIIRRALEAFAYALAVASLVIPALRVVRTAVSIYEAYATVRSQAQLEEARATVRALEAAEDAEFIIEGEYTVLEEGLNDFIASQEAEVVITPP